MCSKNDVDLTFEPNTKNMCEWVPWLCRVACALCVCVCVSLVCVCRVAHQPELAQSIITRSVSGSVRASNRIGQLGDIDYRGELVEQKHLSQGLN